MRSYYGYSQSFHLFAYSLSKISLQFKVNRFIPFYNNMHQCTYDLLGTLILNQTTRNKI